MIVAGVQSDYLASDRALISLRYDQLNDGGLAGERSDGKVLTAQMRYYITVHNEMDLFLIFSRRSIVASLI